MRRLRMLLILMLCVSGCDPKEDNSAQAELECPRGMPAIDTDSAANNIVYLADVSDALPCIVADVFDRYTSVTAPNGKPIHLLAQDGWDDAQIVKARNVLSHILTNHPGSRFGSDKSAVANAIADRNGGMVLFNDEDALNEHIERLEIETNLAMQDLRANETPAEGSADYLAHATRDAAFEEILHFVQDYGIRPVLPEYDAALMRANLAAVSRDAWDPWPDNEPESHHNEYFAVVYDNYLDLWKIKPTLYEGRPIADGQIPDGQSHFGAYRLADNRESVEENDEDGFELIEAFFPPFLFYTPVLPEEFTGTFSIRGNANLRYTEKSKYLKNVSLSGSNPSNLAGNDFDNRLTGNAGDNRLSGNGGDDEIDGGEGNDTATYSGARSEYSIWRDGSRTSIRDCQPDRDGYDVLRDIETLKFSDQSTSLSDEREQATSNGTCHAGPYVLAYSSERDGNADIYQIRTDGTGEKRLTTSPAYDTLPAWSPDGRYIAFESDRDEGRNHIFTLQLSDGTIRQITKGEFSESSAAWSPDGARLAYHSARNEESNIFITDLDSGAERQISRELDYEFISPSFSPDGKWITAEGGASNDSIETAWGTAAKFQIWKISVDGSESTTALTNLNAYNGYPSWSPSGTHIAFDSTLGGWADIHTVSLASGEISNLNKSVHQNEFVSWSSDGQQIAFVSDRDGNNEIYVSGANGSGPMRITNRIGEDSAPTWAPGSFQDTVDPAVSID